MKNFNLYYKNLNNLNEKEFYLFKKDYNYILKKLIYKSKTYLNNKNKIKILNINFDEDELQEIIDESFVYFYSKYDEYDGIHEPSTYLYYVIRNWLNGYLLKRYNNNENHFFEKTDFELEKELFKIGEFDIINLNHLNNEFIINKIKTKINKSGIEKLNTLLKNIEKKDFKNKKFYLQYLKKQINLNFTKQEIENFNY